MNLVKIVDTHRELCHGHVKFHAWEAMAKYTVFHPELIEFGLFWCVGKRSLFSFREVLYRREGRMPSFGQQLAWKMSQPPLF